MSARPNTPTRSEPAAPATNGRAGAPEQVDRALARGVICRALKLGFRYPAEPLQEALFTARGRRALSRAARLLDGQGGEGLRRAVERVVSRRGGTLAALTADHQHLFGPTLRGKVCPYETEYGPEPVFRQANELADIAGYYLAFGLAPDPAGGERVDHVSCEFEFLEFLHLKEAWALQQEDGEMLETTRRAIRGFVRDHLGRFGRAFAARLAREDPEGLHGELGRLSLAFLKIEADHLGVPLGPRLLRLRPIEEDRTPMACGGPASDLLQIRSGRV